MLSIRTGILTLITMMSFSASECLGQEFTLKAGNAEVLASGSVDVPIYIDVNTGVGASTIDFGITYRGFLTLTSISEGSALTGLNGGAGAFQFVFDTTDDATPTTPTGAGTGLKGAVLGVIIPDLALPSPDFLTMGADQEIAVLHFTDGSDKPSAISETVFTNSLSGGLGAVVIEITDDNTTTPGTYNTTDVPAGVALVNGDVLVTTPPVTGFTCIQTDPCTCTVSLTWTNGYLYDTLSLYKDSVDPANLIDTFLPSGGVLAESYVLTQTNSTTYILVGRTNGVDSAEASCTELSDCTDPDTTPPVIHNTPADMPGLKTDLGLCSTTVSWTDPTATDNCSPDPTPSYEVTEGGTPTALTNGGTWPAGNYLVTFSATDVNGNPALPTSFTVTVSDNEAPEILDTPADQFAYKTDMGLCTTTVSWTDPTATDNCSPAPTPTYEVIETVGGTTVALTNGGSWSAGIYLVTFNATDVNGNDAGSTSFNVTVSDNEDPVISGMPGNITQKNDAGFCDAEVTWTEPTDSDNCPGQSLSSTHSSGDFFPVGSATTVTYTSTDAWGNSVTASFTVTINDNEDPVISGMPANITEKNDAGFCDAVVTWTEPTDSDNCPGQVLSSTHDPDDIFPVGMTTVTYTSTDASGNMATASFTVTINDNEEPGAISGMPADIAVKNDAGSCDAVVTWTEMPSAEDNCDGTIAAIADIPSGSTFPVGDTTVTYTATDAAGNTSTAVFTVTVNDNEDPGAISGMPTNIAVKNDAGSCDAVVTWTETPSAEDNCDGTIAAIADISSGSTFGLGDTIVTYTSTDASGNTATASFTVTVNDNENPVIVPGTNVVVTGDGTGCAFAVNVPLPTASDNCGLLGVTNTFNGTADASGDYPYGTTSIIWNALDTNGNVGVAIATQTVTVDPPIDCNSNGESDACDISTGTSQDCNSNGIPDECDIAASTSLDDNSNGVPDECENEFVRGDANNNGNVNIADAYWILLHVFLGRVLDCNDAADVNNDGAIDLADAIYMYSALVGLGPAPVAPFPGCGLDTNDNLGCASYTSCP